MEITKHQKWVLTKIKNGAVCFCSRVINGRYGYEPFLTWKSNNDCGFEEIRIKDITIDKMDKKGLFEWEDFKSNNFLCGWKLKLSKEAEKILL
jgi:hypothetical protein